MKKIILRILCFVLLLFTQQTYCQTAPDSVVLVQPQTSFGVEAGYGFRTDNNNGATVRAFYAAPFGDVDIEGGVRFRQIDDEFGFDLHVRIPFARSTFHLIGGFGMAVHPSTVAFIVPLGWSYTFAKMIEFSLLATPNFYLTKNDNLTTIFEGRIGIRF